MNDKSLGVFGYEELCQRCLGNLALVGRVLDLFEESFGSDIEQLEKQIASGRWDQASRIAHRMKGASGTASAPQLYRLADELGRSLPERREDMLHERMADLHSLGAIPRPGPYAHRREFAAEVAHVIRERKGIIVRVIVADDDFSVVATLVGMLEQLGHDVATAANGREAFELLRSGDYRVVISDWEMPEMDGLELCQRIRDRRLGPYVYVALITARSSKGDLLQGLDAGADDFITKPIEPHELRVRLRAAERVVALESRDLIIFSMARLAESRDPETGAHLERIREYSRLLADDLSHCGPFQDRIDADFVHTIYLTSPLHDIGKVGIPDEVLLKPGPLDASEFEIMKQHAAFGSDTLSAALDAYPQARFLQVARDIAWCHHERYDGRGYPRGLQGEAIPLTARIVSVCDVYDALTSRRQYKVAFSHETAKSEIIQGRGTAFDPAIVDAFLRRERDFDNIRERLSEPASPTTTQATREKTSPPETIPAC